MKQVCTFPHAYHSTPRFNARAYVTFYERKKGTGHFKVWSPVHIPHLLGRYKTEAEAQKRADKINAMGEFIYPE